MMSLMNEQSRHANSALAQANKRPRINDLFKEREARERDAAARATAAPSPAGQIAPQVQYILDVHLI